MRTLRAVIVAVFTVVMACGFGVPLAVFAASTADAQTSDQVNRLRINIDQVSPTLVTAEQSDTVSVSGQLTNVGDRKIDNVQIRLERGVRLDTASALSQAFTDSVTDPAAIPSVRQTFFRKVTNSIAAGQTIPFQITVPLRGTSGDSLQISAPGVYRIMVNANGTPDYGNQAKVGMTMTSLSVLSLPGQAIPKPAAPVKLGLLWPLTDRPHIRSATPANKPVFTDDDLSASLSGGGRLDGLLTAAESMPAAVAPAVCYAIDPDLVGTVQAMTAGYQVQQDNGTTTPGKGQAVAKSWLDRLKKLVQNKCVLALPFADADLNALTNVSANSLVSAAVSDDNTAVLHKVLGITPLTHLVWPGFSAQGSAPSGLRIIPTDALLTQAMGADGSDTPAAISALLSKTQMPAATPVIIAPPHQWNVSAANLTSLTATLQSLISAQYFASESLQQLLALIPESTDTGQSVQQISTDLADKIDQAAKSSNDFLDAMAQDPTSNVSPTTLMQPVIENLLRSASTAWRNNDAGGDKALDHATGALSMYQLQVSIVQPKSPLSLASQDSPLLITVTNNLPVQMKVRLDLSKATGLKPGSIAAQLVSAGSTRVLQVPSQVVRTGQFNVTVGLMTPGGIPLGKQAQLELISTAFGPTTLIITGAAGVLLIVLSSRRIHRRIKRAGFRRAQAARDQQEATEVVDDHQSRDKQPEPTSS